MASLNKEAAADEAADVEITWDMGLQEKSEKLLESYKGMVVTATLVRLMVTDLAAAA